MSAVAPLAARRVSPLRAADPGPLCARARDLLAAGRPAAARPLLAALGRIAPASEEVAELGVRLLLAEAQPEQALLEADRAVAAAPRCVALRRCRAELRARLGEAEAGLSDAAEAVLLDGGEPESVALLGTLLLEVDRAAEASACLREATARRPRHPVYRLAWAQALERIGDVAGAGAALAEAIALAPMDLAPRLALVGLHLRSGAHATAASLAEAARRDGLVGASLVGLHAIALGRLGETEAAAAAFAEARALAPADTLLCHLAMLSAACAAAPPGAARLPPAVVRAAFDAWSAGYDADMLGQGYRVPGLLRALLTQTASASPIPAGPVLDLGCGTGLLGVVLSDGPPGPLTGIDLSADMLARARATGTYVELREADIEQALADPAGQWPLVLAADSLCFLGPLEGLFGQLRQRLAPGGRIVCSLETAAAGTPPPGGWCLGATGRYRHAPDYPRAAAAAAGLTILAERHETLRMEAGTPVSGVVLALGRAADAG